MSAGAGDEQMNVISAAKGIQRPDDLYAQLIGLTSGIDDDEAFAAQARLILLLANHIGDSGVIGELVEIAGRTGDVPVPRSSEPDGVPHPVELLGIHHAAYRCMDAKATADWYARTLGMEFQKAFSENHVPSTGEFDPYMHIFLECGGGNVLAFFEIPNHPAMGRDVNTPSWVQHIAFEVADMAALTTAKRHLQAEGVEVLGPTDHGIFRSIYFFDPNGHRLELACNVGTFDQYAELRRVAPLMLEEWSRTKKAPRHASWLHAAPKAPVE